MFKKIIYLILSLAIFQIQAGVPSEKDLEFTNYLKKNSSQIEKLVNDLPLEARDEILTLEGLSPEESQPIITDIFNHYGKETGANYNDNYEWTNQHTYILVGSLLLIAILVNMSDDDERERTVVKRTSPPSQRRYDTSSYCHTHYGNYNDYYHCH